MNFEFLIRFVPIPHLIKSENFKSWNKPYKKRKPKKVISKLLVALFFVFFFAASGSIVLLAWFSRELPNPDKIIDRQISQSTKIYDRTGKVLLYDIFRDKKRTLLNLDQISNYTIWATLAAEDKNFFEHRGFSFLSILRAFLVNLIQGGKLQGGSTITQQLIKNSILSPEKTYLRKIKELVLSYQIEKKFSKSQILKMYFNEIPYGSTVYGIESAAQTFFAKSAKDLNIAESALLAALPKAPSHYSPYGNFKNELLGRQKYILDIMAEEKFISAKEAEEAKKIDILAQIRPKKDIILAPHFVMYIKDILTQKYGEKMIEYGGLKVYTTLDFNYQQSAEKILQKKEKFLNSFKAKNAALTAIDSKTGQILAMVGSIDYFNPKIDGNVNVTLRPRQPGSSFKPIVYAAAFLKGYTPNTLLYDVDTMFKAYQGDYNPKNYTQKNYGLVTMRQALAGSLNVPSVKTIYLTGIENVLDLAEKMGYSTFADRSRFGLSLVLGGGEVKLLEHTAAFGIFAQEGNFYGITPILKIEDSEGRILEEWKQEEPKKILDPEITRQINDILSDNEARSFIFGRQNFLTLKDRPVAVKTGTTNDFRDAWTIGYTPSLVAGVWVGNNDFKAMGEKADGSNIAAPIWNEFMSEVLKGAPVENFTKHAPTLTGKPVLDGEGLGAKIKIDKASGKIATELTPPSFVITKIISQPHDILYFIKKDDPRGNPPTEEERLTDPQFENWEKAVQTWLGEQGFIEEQIPTEYDDLHTLEAKPKIKIISPLEKEAINAREFNVTLETSSPRTLSRVLYFIDDKITSASYNYPFNTTIFIPGDLSKGFHTLKTILYDDIDNNNSDQILFNLSAEIESLPFDWINPKENSLIPSFPVKLNIYLRETDLKEINFSFRKSDSFDFQTIGRIFNPQTQNIELDWSEAPPTGDYYLKTSLLYSSGGKKENEIKIQIK